ncbi:PPA1309 family protein [Nocardia paucivorans]|uniref:PPA1309 family protein n=1 Tax=Nocardia paucivorans TaxID=114259 RepID=UPI0003145A16
MSSDLHAEVVLAHSVREVAEFVDAEGWGAAPQMFALVPTAELIAVEPGLIDQVDTADELTPVAQELPEEVSAGTVGLDEFLATTSWPATVAGCVLVQEIVVLPPEAEDDLDAALTPLLAADTETADAAGRAAAQAHPRRRDARLFAAALRSGRTLCLLQLRPEADEDGDLELRTHPNLAPNLVEALRHTLDQPAD